MTSDDRDNLLLLAAGALSDDEALELRARLAAGAPEEIGAMAEAEAVLAQLALALPSQSPSAEARTKLMDRVAATSVGGSGQSTTMRLTSGSAAAPAARVATRWPMLMSLAASILIFAVSIALIVAARRDVGQMTRSLDVAQQERAGCQMSLAASELSLNAARETLANSTKASEDQLAALKAQLADKESSLGDARAKLASMTATIGADQLQLVGLAMPAPDPARKARGRILWDKEKNQWLVAVFDLAPPARADREYELWFITPDQRKVRATTFNTSGAGGEALITVDVPKDIGEIALAAITDEPIGGSDQPTGTIQLVGKVE